MGKENGLREAEFFAVKPQIRYSTIRRIEYSSKQPYREQKEKSLRAFEASLFPRGNHK